MAKITLRKFNKYISLLQAGFHDVSTWRANQSKDWAGTLVLTEKK